jgi:hypothetical protein
MLYYLVVMLSGMILKQNYVVNNTISQYIFGTVIVQVEAET